MATLLIGRGAITAIFQPIAEVTARAVALIIAGPPDPTGDAPITVPAELAIRESTRAPV